MKNGDIVNVLWVDGYEVKNCMFLRKERGFYVFVQDGRIVFARITSVTITEV